VGSPSAVTTGWVAGNYVSCTYHDFFSDSCTGCADTTDFSPDPLAGGAHVWEYIMDFDAGTWDFHLDGVPVRTGCTIPAAMNASRTIGTFGDQGDNTNLITATMASWEIELLP
jgi:hypothetical protein